METLPPIGKAKPEELKEWVDSEIMYNNALRAAEFAADLRADLYDAGIQWLRRAAGGGDGPGSYSQYTKYAVDPSDPEWVPTPVLNEGFWARINESARLGRARFRPVTSPSGDNPTIQTREAAQKAVRSLRHDLREMEWDKEEAVAAYHSPCYGGVWIEVSWEQTWDKTSRVPSQDAVCCPRKLQPEQESISVEIDGVAAGSSAQRGCGFVLATPEIEEDEAPYLMNLAVMSHEGGKHKAMACPECDDHPELVPYQMTMQEAMEGKDSLGRPMGQEQPLGQLCMQVVDPREMFPKNMGLNTKAGSINEWRRVHVESLDWVAMRYPGKVGEVKPENSETLARFHPVAGAPDLFGDPRIFRDCVRVKQAHKKPWMEKQRSGIYRINQGRSVVMAGDTVLLDAPYLMDSLTEPGKRVPRVYVDYAHWELRNGGRHLSGLSMWELLFDPQDIRNEVASQRSAVRQRMAVPLYVWPTNVNVEIMALRSGTPGRHVSTDLGPDSQNLPRVINNEVLNPGTETESQDAIQYMQHGQAEVERGQVPQNVGAALAIQYLQTAAGEGRQPRIDRWKALLKRCWSVALQLKQAMTIEPRPCRFEDEAGEERWEAYSGLDFAGQTNVDVEAEGDVDSSAEKIAKIRDAFELGLLQAGSLSPTQRRRINEYTDLPDDLFQEEDEQEAAAQREWLEFREHGKRPVVDPSMDDPVAHYQQHGRDANSEYFRDLASRADWCGALEVLGATWEPVLVAVQQPEMVAADAQPSPPRTIQARIEEAWQKQLEMAQFQSPDPTALSSVIQWRAHMEAHKGAGSAKQAVANTGAPVLAAPGADMTAAGTMPAAPVAQ